MQEVYYLYLILAVLLVGGILATTATFAQSDSQIPSWIRNVALFWGQGDIDDSEFVNLIQYLIDNEIIAITGNSDTESVKSLQNEISDLKRSIATDIQNAYDDGYHAGFNKNKINKESITVTTDKQVYSDGDIITITGKVVEPKSNVVTTVIKSPFDYVLSINQITLDSDNKFNTEYRVGCELWKQEGMGKYTITVLHETENNSTSTTFAAHTGLAKLREDRHETENNSTSTTFVYDGKKEIYESRDSTTNNNNQFTTNTKQSKDILLVTDKQRYTLDDDIIYVTASVKEPIPTSKICISASIDGSSLEGVCRTILYDGVAHFEVPIERHGSFDTAFSVLRDNNDNIATIKINAQYFDRFEILDNMTYEPIPFNGANTISKILLDGTKLHHLLISNNNIEFTECLWQLIDEKGNQLNKKRYQDQKSKMIGYSFSLDHMLTINGDYTSSLECKDDDSGNAYLIALHDFTIANENEIVYDTVYVE